MKASLDLARLSVNASGAFYHPLGDQSTIDCRYGEVIDSIELPHRQLLQVQHPARVSYGSLINPRAVIVWNVSGVGLQTLPTEEEAAEIAARILLVGLCDGKHSVDEPRGWQMLLPARVGHDQGGSCILWLPPSTHVVLRPQSIDHPVLARLLIIPGEA